MNQEQARQILLMYRPGTADATDPDVAATLELARRDTELGQWLDQHLAFQKAMRSKLRQVEVPSHLKAQILAQRNIVRPDFQRTRGPLVWMAAAAVIFLVVGLSAILLQPGAPDKFANFQDRMVRTVLRQYRMDVLTSDMQQVRSFMAEKGAPSDFAITKGLKRLQLTGGGLLHWRNNAVAMVCFDRGDRQMLYLFIMNRSAVKDPPPANPSVAKVNKLITVAWTEADKTYVLAGPEEADFTSKYF